MDTLPVGSKYGEWTVISSIIDWRKTKPYYYCKCACGQERWVAGASLSSGYSTSCGCSRATGGRDHARRIKDISGQRFGKLVAISYSHSHHGAAFWKCTCDCGNEFVARGSTLRLGKMKHCGCGAPVYAPKPRETDEKLPWNEALAKANHEARVARLSYGRYIMHNETIPRLKENEL